VARRAAVAKVLARDGATVARGKRSGTSKGLTKLLTEAKAGAQGRKAGATGLHVKVAALRAEIRAARTRD